MAGLTPMKIQYNELKEQHQGCLLFFRLGDFYEMFDEDAIVASRELEIALTTRDKKAENPEDRTPMCGVPYHSAEAYIARLIAKGYKVAICEQDEQSDDGKGIRGRRVVRVITPGTVTESSMLEEGKSNYIAAVYLEGGTGAVCFADVSTGEICAASWDSQAREHVLNELGRFSPVEAVLSTGAAADEAIREFLAERLNCLTETAESRFDYTRGEKLCRDKFGSGSVDGLGDSAAIAAGALLGYLEDTQKCSLDHINAIDCYSGGRYMEIDYSARRSLELTENMRTNEKRGSLLWALDKTRTPMGGRLLRQWVERPLLSPVDIGRRLSAVQELSDSSVVRSELMLEMRGIGDIQRFLSKLSYGSANGRDLLSLSASLGKLPQVTGLLAGASSALLREIAQTDTLADITQLIERAICDEPPFSVREGGILREGYSEEVDTLRRVRDNGAQMLSELEVRERESTGIRKLKVGYNRVFGYYIDVPNSAGEMVPDTYMRKQTLASSERYFTQELKELENELLTAKDRISGLEYTYFTQVVEKIAEEMTRIQSVSEHIARLDALCSLAESAVKNNYVRPEIDMSKILRITEGRHPVVELTQTDTIFVPNDVYLDDENDRLAIITGPNMAGKSTYMRQTALIVLMAQIGSFVPAKSATIGIVDRVFTRIGASDDLSSGQSTFMVEMTETAAILKQATDRSLLILDEIGRGTSTYDGMAIARAVLEYCADKRRLGAKTMFATHYHELSALEHEHEGVRNYNVTAKKQDGKLNFLRKVTPGPADESYGIEVAKLAGVPDSVIKRAAGYLLELESGVPERFVERAPESQMSLTDVAGSEIAERLRKTVLDTVTPIEAMNLLYELKKKADS